MTPGSVLVESCVTSVEEAGSSVAAGARRVELCRVLEVGGLTPSVDSIQSVRASVAVPLMALVRPSAESFRLSPADVASVAEDVAAVASVGVDGIVLGALDEAGRIDQSAITELVDAANGLPVTFHRAFDEVADPMAGIDVLARAGVTRVLTSGGAPTAWEGRETLGELVRGGSGVTVLAGGTIRGDHVLQLVSEVGLSEVHCRAAAVPDVVKALASSA